MQIARGQRAAVVSGHSSATRIAIEMLENGGNFVDAAVAGAAALCVALPHACGLGGDCFILVHEGGKTASINGSGSSPSRLPQGLDKEVLSSGPLSCATPGMLGAWETLHEKFGRKAWRDALAPAITLAHAGVVTSPELGKALATCRQGLLEDDGCRHLFLSGPNHSEDCRPYHAAVAQSLSAIAEGGGKVFYRGSLGVSLCAASAARGGTLQTDDLDAYEPLWCEPLSVEYRGYSVRVAPPNSFGLLMLLQLAALGGISMCSATIDSTKRLRHLMMATKLAVEAGTPFLCDPRQGRNPAAALTPEALGRLQAAMDGEAAPAPATSRSNGTAVISVADRDGNGVTIVQSIFTPFGSMVADLKTGVVLNNRLLGFSIDPADPNVAAPAKRPAHTLSPAMMFKDGKLVMLLGTPGGTGQTITLTQVLTNVVDYALPLDQAIELPRWAMDIGGNFVVEPELADSIVQELNAGGLAVKKAAPAQRFFFGSAECIAIADDGFTAAADYRRDATAAAI